MAEFYVNRKSEEGEAEGHLVHNANCSAMPDKSEILYLGSFASGEAAISKAKGYYNPVSCCSSCLPK